MLKSFDTNLDGHGGICLIPELLLGEVYGALAQATGHIQAPGLGVPVEALDLYFGRGDDFLVAAGAAAEVRDGGDVVLDQSEEVTGVT